MEERQAPAPHKFILNQRNTCTMTGVTDVLSFDINEIMLETTLGVLMIRGKDLHVNRLTLEKGEVDLSGTIDSLQYSDMSKMKSRKEPLLTRLFQ